mgnify:CR=1 FL=1
MFSYLLSLSIILILFYLLKHNKYHIFNRKIHKLYNQLFKNLNKLNQTANKVECLYPVKQCTVFPDTFATNYEKRNDIYNDTLEFQDAINTRNSQLTSNDICKFKCSYQKCWEGFKDSTDIMLNFKNISSVEYNNALCKLYSYIINMYVPITKQNVMLYKNLDDWNFILSDIIDILNEIYKWSNEEYAFCDEIEQFDKDNEIMDKWMSNDEIIKLDDNVEYDKYNDAVIVDGYITNEILSQFAKYSNLFMNKDGSMIIELNNDDYDDEVVEYE